MVKLLRLSVGRGTLLGVGWHLNSQLKTIYTYIDYNILFCYIKLILIR